MNMRRVAIVTSQVTAIGGVQPGDQRVGFVLRRCKARGRLSFQQSPSQHLLHTVRNGGLRLTGKLGKSGANWERMLESLPKLKGWAVQDNRMADQRIDHHIVIGRQPICQRVE